MTQRNYTEADQAAVRILRAAYMLTDGPESDILYDARQYLQDRQRYEHQFASGQRWNHACDCGDYCGWCHPETLRSGDVTRATAHA